MVAEYAGFCFGVKRAVDIAIKNRENKDGSTHTLGPLIHNDDVVNYLKGQGIAQIRIEDLSKLGKEDKVVIRSHGVTPETIKLIEETGAKTIDATCPYVASIQRKIKRYYSKGYQIIIVGDADHPEVEGINGWCDNRALVTKNGENIKSLSEKVCIVAQTTERQENFDNVVKRASDLSEDILAFNTICSATKERQESADQVSKRVDLMIVIGGKHSSNSRKLYDICKGNCRNTIFIENGKELKDYILDSEAIGSIGVTAGASTPDWVIDDILTILKSG
ncbi:MAG TPA: 4-hydroxy-3-methylbut-2-enyl diphosphate reductase [Bacillota bacterium]|nr:4-hydroxy-3-methylbut-2-enyl diphosphate reductase [Bacillota bacterium]